MLLKELMIVNTKIFIESKMFDTFHEKNAK